MQITWQHGIISMQIWLIGVNNKTWIGQRAFFFFLRYCTKKELTELSCTHSDVWRHTGEVSKRKCKLPESPLVFLNKPLDSRAFLTARVWLKWKKANDYTVIISPKSLQDRLPFTVEEKSTIISTIGSDRLNSKRCLIAPTRIHQVCTSMWMLIRRLKLMNFLGFHA